MSLSDLPTLNGRGQRPNQKPAPRCAKATRVEARIKRAVRAQCVLRDGFCRVASASYYHPAFRLFGRCDGVSEWAHLEGARRFKTRKRAPELRHTTAGTCMLCTRHHRAYDARQIAVEVLTAAGADGPLVWHTRAGKWQDR